MADVLAVVVVAGGLCLYGALRYTRAHSRASAMRYTAPCCATGPHAAPSTGGAFKSGHRYVLAEPSLTWTSTTGEAVAEVDCE